MLELISFPFFFVVAITTILFWVNLWQLKEYRLDRFSVHMRDTSQGRSIFLSTQSILSLIGFILALLSIFSDTVSNYFPYAIFLILVFLTIEVFQLAINRKIKRPILTLKAVAISLVSLVLTTALVFFPLTDPFLWFLICLVVIPFLVALSVFLFAFPTEIYTDIYLQKAKEKRKNLKNLKVIAVSGSYGKSSTKEVIAHILSQRYKVVKTNLSNNTPLAIAKTLLKKINNDTDFFVVELGAYKKGEIRQLAEVVAPTMSVTTAVSDQHLALYGTFDDVIASELELIHELPKNSLVLLNGNSEGVRKMAEKVKHMQIIWYKTEEKKETSHMVVAAHIVPNTKGVKWEYRAKNKSVSLYSPLLGIHTVENILPGIFLGFLFQLTDQEVQQGVKTLHPLPKTMERKDILPGISVIDDSFNASPESVISASEFLQLFPKRKFFVLSPLIELGKMSKIRHREIGEKLAHVDFLYVTNTNFITDIKQGIQAKNGKARIITGSYRYLAKSLRDVLKKGDAVVFEGKEAGIVLHLI